MIDLTKNKRFLSYFYNFKVYSQIGAYQEWMVCINNSLLTVSKHQGITLTPQKCSVPIQT